MDALLRYWKVGLMAVVLGVTGAGFAGCHTVEGMGRDVQAVGEGTEEAADDLRPYDQERRR